MLFRFGSTSTFPAGEVSIYRQTFTYYKGKTEGRRGIQSIFAVPDEGMGGGGFNQIGR
jgi:hypothetical protein